MNIKKDCYDEKNLTEKLKSNLSEFYFNYDWFWYFIRKNKDWICLFSYVKSKKWDELYDFLQCCKNDKDWKKYIIDFMKNYTWNIYTTISKIK